MKVHQFPAPTHPLSRVSLSQWKLLAPEWEAGLSSTKKPALCFLDHATTRNSLRLSAFTLLLCRPNLWLSRVADWAAGTGNQSSPMLAKNMARLHYDLQTSTGAEKQVEYFKSVSKLTENFKMPVVWLQQGLVTLSMFSQDYRLEFFSKKKTSLEAS